MKLNLVDGRRDFKSRIGKELLKILDGEVRDTDVLDTTRLRELLKLSPCVLEVPVGVVLAQVLGVGGGGPMLVRVSMDVV